MDRQTKFQGCYKLSQYTRVSSKLGLKMEYVGDLVLMKAIGLEQWKES